MDDPWGSPWADEIQLPQSIKSADKPDVDNRQTTPARAATLVLQEKTSSPWNDAEDDGFGEWATMPAESGRSLGFHGQVDNWEGSEPAVTPNANFSALSPDWDGSQEKQLDEDAKLSPNPFLKPTGVARQPSLDPWTTSFTFNDETTPSTPDRTGNEGGDKIASTEEDSEKHVSVEKNLGTFDEKLPPAAEQTPEGKSRGHIFDEKTLPEAFNEKLLPGGEDTPAEEATTVDGTEDEMAGRDGHNTPPSVAPEIAPPVEGLDGDPASSRPSSSPSEHSQHDELSQESPRTSLDEEPKRPQVTRKVSSKVQELVQHFDGLAKQDAGDTIASSMSSGQDTTKGVDEPQEEEDDDDFGDFEEGHSDDEQETAEAEIPPPAAQDQASTDSASRKEVLPKPTVKSFVGPVEFNIDMSALEKVYPNLKADSVVEKVFVPDTIPYDSFSSTEERKIWYRVSRYGTMRKHNSGDDDYIRINWPQSQIRTETLKVVARWMEEDRISGRVVLGGGSKGSSVFGWNDKKATPVPLANALAAKVGKQNPEAAVENVPEIPREWPQDLVRKTSISKKKLPRTSRRSSVKPPQSPEETKSAVELPVANFGWNAAPQMPQSLDHQPLPGHKPSGSMSNITAQRSKMVSPLRRSTSVQRLSNGTAATINPAPPKAPSIVGASGSSTSNLTGTKPRLTNLSISDVTNDDDDWGDMVASPTIKVQSQLLDSTGNITKLAKTSVGLNDGVRYPTSNHRSTPSFVDILKPQPAIFINSQKKAAKSSVNTFSTTVPNQLPSQLVQISTSSTTSALDPWASADFSFFETSPAPPSKPTFSVAPKAASEPVSLSPSPLAPPRSDRKSREELEQDKIVQRVVKSLPDLSYMLRR